ncbi:hypothetical protein ACXX9E_29590 [Pseudomonas sp. GNP014]
MAAARRRKARAARATRLPAVTWNRPGQILISLITKTEEFAPALLRRAGQPAVETDCDGQPQTDQEECHSETSSPWTAVGLPDYFFQGSTIQRFKHWQLPVREIPRANANTGEFTHT